MPQTGSLTRSSGVEPPSHATSTSSSTRGPEGLGVGPRAGQAFKLKGARVPWLSLRPSNPRNSESGHGRSHGSSQKSGVTVTVTVTSGLIVPLPA
eukprot:3211336-Rhodomonas_salina.1